MAPRRKKAPPAEDQAVIPPVPAALGPEAASQADTLRLRRALAEWAGRQAESLKLYEPLPVIEAFHADRRDERLLRGSNRAGKTLGAAVEVARAVTGQDPHDKYPAEGGRAILVGLDGNHCGEVMYRKLFRGGAFKMIRDLETGAWRAYRPATDAHRSREAKPAPPLVPHRHVKEVAWEEKKRSIPKLIRLKNGWELSFYSSKGHPPNGIDVDLFWIDEEIENEAWWPELVARLLDRRGKGLWSATPQVASEHLFALHERAESGDPNVGEHIALLEDNPHIDEEEKKKFESRLVSEEERRVRLKGEFALTGFKIYPDFSTAVHGLDWDGPVPDDWCRFMIVDPGRQVCAVLFGAVPPPGQVDDSVVLYDELYIKHSDAKKFAAAVHAKSGGVGYEAFVIDSHAGRVTEMGSGKNVEVQFSEELKALGVKSRKTGYGFAWGADDPKAGIYKVHDWLRVRPCGTPRLRVLRGRLPAFESEIKRYHYKRVKMLVTDEPEKRNDHLMDCLRYLAMYDPKYHRPARRKMEVGGAVRALRDKRKRAEAKGGGRGVNLGPGQN